MFVGVARIVLSIPGARSLKDRRRVVHAFRDRVRARISVSIAELGDLDRHQLATLGVAVVARDSAHVSELLASVVRMARGLRDALLSDVATEIVPYGEAGGSIRGTPDDFFGGSGDDDDPDAFDDDPDAPGDDDAHQ